MSRRPPRAVVRAAIRAAVGDLQPGDRVIVALSGGPDSLALLAGTLRVSQEVGLLCAAVVVDHGLQPDSATVAANAAEQARVLGCVDITVQRVDVASSPGHGGPEAAARSARYAALDAAAAGDLGQAPAAAILLGHTRDDQAESVLLGLARGSGVRSLAGMAAHAGRYRRSLLGVPRDVVQAAAAAQAREDPRLAPWDDPHNASDRYARARVRHTVLPELERALGPGIAESLARTATLARADADALDQWADEVWQGAVVDGVDGAVRVAALVDAPPAIRSRVVRRLLLAANCQAGKLTAEHVHGVVRLLDDTPAARAVVTLPGGRQAHREGPLLRVRV